MTANGYEVSFWGDENFVELDDGDSCKTMNILLFLFPMCTHAKLFQSCPTLCNPMDYSLPGSSVHAISQERILE